MLELHRYTLDNGLRLVVHSDTSSPLVAVNLLYDVGSRNENPEKTGFAHLFEHLMFSGSRHVQDFDLHMQLAGGENNAFTTSDLTNYYCILPANNIETALWLESDRMRDLLIGQESLNIQKSVVIEEFKETCLNQPYGDVWHQLSPLAYKKHPYQWPTIGKNPDHIEFAQLEDVQKFFEMHYHPGNAILVLTGNIQPQAGLNLSQKWFGDISPMDQSKHLVEKEPLQQKLCKKVIEADVPANAIYMAFHMPGRKEFDYYVCDIISDILSNGRSSRFYQKLYKGKRIFSHIDAYITGSLDPGLFIVEGKIHPEFSVEAAERAVWDELNLMKEIEVEDFERQKVINKIENSLIFSEVNILNKAISLAYFEWLGDAYLINEQVNMYGLVTKEDICRCANSIFRSQNCTEIVYVQGSN